MEQYAFGFLQTPLNLDNSSFQVRPIDKFEAAVKSVLNEPTAGKRWFYPPISMSPTEGIYLPSPRYELPVTHLLTTQKRTHVAGYGEFLVEILGFILGIRLTTEGTGHLWPTPLRQGQLVGFIPKRSEMLFCLERATSFWETHFEVRRLMFGAVHWFLVSHSYQNQYERFSWMYTVLDTLHRIAWHVSDRYRRRLPDRKGSHGERPKALSETFGSPLPETFGDPNKQVGNVAALLKARNELVHEARWTDEPLGHAVSEEGQRMIYEMTHFCSQIILGLMNVPCGFRTAAYSRSGHGLDVEM